MTWLIEDVFSVQNCILKHALKTDEYLLQTFNENNGGIAKCST